MESDAISSLRRRNNLSFDFLQYGLFWNVNQLFFELSEILFIAEVKSLDIGSSREDPGYNVVLIAPDFYAFDNWEVKIAFHQKLLGIEECSDLDLGWQPYFSIPAIMRERHTSTKPNIFQVKFWTIYLKSILDLVDIDLF